MTLIEILSKFGTASCKRKLNFKTNLMHDEWEYLCGYLACLSHTGMITMQEYGNALATINCLRYGMIRDY